jgi:hypothetical protein
VDCGHRLVPVAADMAIACDLNKLLPNRLRRQRRAGVRQTLLSLAPPVRHTPHYSHMTQKLSLRLFALLQCCDIFLLASVGIRSKLRFYWLSLLTQPSVVATGFRNASGSNNATVTEIHVLMLQLCSVESIGCAQLRMHFQLSMIPQQN